MKYKKIEIESYGEPCAVIQIALSEEQYTGFIASAGQATYEQFLLDAGLTDEELQALTTDVWFDFPLEETA